MKYSFSNVSYWHKADCDYPSDFSFSFDDELKARSYAALAKMGVIPSEALRLMLEYIADNERLPFKQILLSDEDAEFVEIV
ncbi:type II toxin-antitoxin system RelB/DinJ family antitoxin [Enterobacter asburiae]|nr:type II toxin-antitoxin system RelB/DinJ family antitoxin [Enterobacter asburiae]MEB8258201.1 type II toxin-antitoxin system RelB/DinJ family antitoxin [Enterobacter asburiae]